MNLVLAQRNALVYRIAKMINNLFLTYCSSNGRFLTAQAIHSFPTLESQDSRNYFCTIKLNRTYDHD